MLVDENKASASRIWDEIWNLGALDVVDEVIAEDYVGHIPAMPEIRGADGFRQLITTYRAAYPDLHLTIEDVIASGDRVVVRWTSRGTNTGDLMGMPATGKSVVVPGISIFRFEDGKVAEEWEGFDTLGMMQQLGMGEPAAA
jgi:steroid delta-isomerase-like uncharacterized protein